MNLPLFKLANVLVRFNHVASAIVNADQRHLFWFSLFGLALGKDGDRNAHGQWTNGNQ
jgi:hypothetical protein